MHKRISTLLLEILLILVFTFCLAEHKLVIYALKQGKGQLIIVSEAKPIEEVLKDTTFPDSLKQKLKLIIDIKQYTFDSLGMQPSENYSSVFDQRNQSLLLNVSACEPFALKPKEWTFPFLGAVPYKGFFNKKDAKEEIEKLKQDGYDVDAYSPSGWSTLGWFKDPILSNMLKLNEGRLANLIIHELTHGTLFVKNDVSFNENLASFIGDKGAEQFLIQRFGKESQPYISYIQNKSDEKIYNEYILKSAECLDSLYKAIPAKEDILLKKVKKEKLIMEIVLGVNRLPLFKKKKYFTYSLQAFAEGNAFFMAFKRYDSQYEFFENEFKTLYRSNLKKYLGALKEKYPSL